MLHKRRSRGSALIEFCLTGIPLIFIWISIEEVGRGVWNYHTLQYAAKTAGAYAAVHGATCAISPNACTVTISNIASAFQTAAIGIPTSQVVLTFTTASGAATSCNLGGTSNLCSSLSTTWPPASNSDNAVGKSFEINAMYTFHSALAMVAPGPGGGPVKFGSMYFPGDTQQIIQY
jgi:Flp pilus assembly protein TadG